MDLITEQELAGLKATKNEQEWNKVCDQIKAARNGKYPSDWYAKVMASGLAARITLGWQR